MLNTPLPFGVNLRARNTRRNLCSSCTLVTPQLAREPSLLRPFRPNPLKFPGNTGGL